MKKPSRIIPGRLPCCYAEIAPAASVIAWRKGSMLSPNTRMTERFRFSPFKDDSLIWIYFFPFLLSRRSMKKVHFPALIIVE
jgi:hypothetical protein